MSETRSSALFKRAEQLRRWEESDTNKQSPNPKNAAKIQFSSGIVFLAACTAGDKEEVQRLLNAGADINTANVDGLTALHQACIDDNLDMVEFLLSNGADVNRGDNEGWTPLHATASCGFLSIARYLLENGADPGAVNYDGELPIDLTENKSMQTILQKNINEKGIDCNAARKAEVNSLLADAKHWASNGYVEVRDLKTGGTPLHVAAAKGYNQVLQILLEQCKLDPDCVDYEGWTPLHAAALWSQKESAALLLKYGADPNIKNFSGQTCMDLVDPKLAPWLTSAISEAQATTRVNNNNIHKRKLTPPKLEVKRQDLDRVPEIVNMPNGYHDQHAVPRPVRVENSQRQKNKNNSTEKICDAKPPKGLPAAPETVIDENQNADETPSWRRSASFRTKQNDASQDNKTSASGDNGPAADGDIILRRTHSFENDRTFYERYRDVTARIKASSCPSIPPLPQSTIAGVESRKKLLEQISNANHPNSPTENTNDDVQARIGTPEKIERESNSTPSATNNTAPTAVRRSFVPPVRDEESETQRKAHAKRVRETRRSTQGVTLDEIKSAEQFVKKKAGNGVATVETAPAKKSNEEPSVPAVNKDANSTRGKWVSDVAVTLALAAATATATATIAPTAERRPTWRLRLETNKFELEDAARSPSPRPTNNSADTTVTLPLRRVVTNAVNNNTAATVVNNTGDDKGTDDDKEREGSVDSKTGSNSSLSSTQAALNVIQRRRRPKRRSTGVGHVDIDDIVNDRAASCDGDSENESRQSGSERTSEVETPALTNNAAAGPTDERDYKALYEASSAEVRRLRELLNTSEQQLRDARSTISRLTRMSQSSLSEIEKREKRAMERKLSEMEEELKFQQALQAENQRLKDENGALIRVISKLSK